MQFIYMLFLLLVVRLGIAQEVSVPVGHSVYPFLKRLIITHALPPQPATRPYSRMKVAQLLYDARAYMPNRPVQEQQRLDAYLQEFAEEIKRLDIEGIAEDYWRLGNYKGDTFALFGDYVFRQTAYDIRGGTPSQITAFQRSSGATVWGYLGEHVGFDFYGVDTKESSSEHFSGIKQSYFGENVGYTDFTDSGYALYYDKTNAHISFTTPWFSLLFGKEEQGWGPGRHGQLALANQAVPFDHVRFSAQMGRIYFTSMHGKLISPRVGGRDPDHPLYRFTDGFQVYRDRYIAGHRVEVMLPFRIRAGVHEMLLYSDRNIEFAYLNPLMFFWSAEHHLNDQDNSTIGLDFSVGTVPHVEMYGELFLDDLKTDSLFTPWFGNKIGYLAGCQYSDLPYFAGTDLIVEYTRVEPWVYTHRRAANTYSNKGLPLGYWLGPNGDNLTAEFRWSPTTLIDVSLFVGRSRNGENVYLADSLVNTGGDITIGHSDGDTQKKSFLNGIKEERLTFRCETKMSLTASSIEKKRWLFFLKGTRLRAIYQWSQLENVLSGDIDSPRENRIEQQLSVALEYNFRS